MKKMNTVEFAKLNLSTGEMEIEELDMRARYDEIGAWQLCNGHLYYTTLNSNAYLVDCDLTEGGYIDNILEDKCPLVNDRRSGKFNVLGDWLYYKYGYKLSQNFFKRRIAYCVQINAVMAVKKGREGKNEIVG